MNKEVSVVICTHDRRDYLRRSVESVGAQSVSPERFEVIVVDNACTDGSREMVESVFPRMENLRYVEEPTLGLARARNTGLGRARGRYVAFLDDDAIAAPDWLERILEFFETTRPEPGMVGGRVDPIWGAPRPAWLSDGLARALTIVDWPVEGPSLLSESQWVSAANLVFPRSVLEQLGGCRTDLGRQGDRLLSNEENLLRIQVEGLGLKCYYHPGIRVSHHAHAARLTQSWFKRRLRWQGVSQARMERYSDPRGRIGRGLSGLRAFVKMGISPSFIRTLLRHTTDPEAFKKQCRAQYRIGYAAGLVGVERWMTRK